MVAKRYRALGGRQSRDDPRSKRFATSRPALLIALVGFLPTIGLVDQATASVADARVVGRYRAQLSQLIDELDVLPGQRSGADVGRLLEEWLRHPDVARVIDAVPGGAPRVWRQALEEYAGFAPSVASNAADPLALLRIVLLQQVDLAWWAASADFPDEASIAASSDFVDLSALEQVGGVRFNFGVASDRLVRRARDYAVQRLLPGREPRGPGLPFRRARPEMVAVLNEIADRVALVAPPATPAIWINSIVRSVAHQRRLRALGFTALLPSAHCRGWAADIELAWFDRFHASGALRDVLLDYQSSGVLNVIDEGRAWHLCLAPHARVGYGEPAAARRPAAAVSGAL